MPLPIAPGMLLASANFLAMDSMPPFFMAESAHSCGPKPGFDCANRSSAKSGNGLAARIRLVRRVGLDLFFADAAVGRERRCDDRSDARAEGGNQFSHAANDRRRRPGEWRRGRESPPNAFAPSAPPTMLTIDPAAFPTAFLGRLPRTFSDVAE